MHPASGIEVWRAAYSCWILSDSFWLILRIILLNVLFSIGSTVLWRVICVGSCDTVLTYQVQDVNNRRRRMVVHFNHLEPYKQRIQTPVKDRARDKPPQDSTLPRHHFGAESELVDDECDVGKAFYNNKGAWPWPVQFLWLSLGYLWKYNQYMIAHFVWLSVHFLVIKLHLVVKLPCGLYPQPLTCSSQRWFELGGIFCAWLWFQQNTPTQPVNMCERLSGMLGRLCEANLHDL